MTMAWFKLSDGCAAVSVNGKTVSANKEGLFNLSAAQASALHAHNPVPVTDDLKKADEPPAPPADGKKGGKK
jgi:hypothetical protein